MGHVNAEQPGVNASTPSAINAKIAVIGLGYVGLPLAIEFGKKYDVLGFDIDIERVSELKSGKDRTQETDFNDLAVALNLKEKDGIGLTFSTNIEDLHPYDTYIVTVPTPIDHFKAPDLTPLIKASEMLGKVIGKGNIVIYESTVYPGCTEEDCVPVLEQVSGLKFNEDFFVGYSPERVNPGDKVNTLTKIRKVTSGSTLETARWVDDLYRSIIKAGTHRAPSIKVAEASKAIENAQRDVNISFVNELALIFDRMGIDTYDVLAAAGTKWNFLPYKPGLVGGHCISVDPYYLAHRAERLGYTPNVILSGRRVNEQMGAFVASKVVKLMLQKNISVKGARALIMGITFKENCPDIRNTGVVNIYNELVQFGLSVDLYDPWADAKAVKHEYGLDMVHKMEDTAVYDAVVVAVAHREFLTFDYQKIKRHNGVIFDTKACLDRRLVDGRL
ncbi:UDP-N-acetyl-D-galactosamine dehydrogenase [Parapedobacter luteus]|uniref:UDP-N-acetyl-D-galactosamine dehydrogenase n=1 Tax=Parapedobacter luteus TaxID=623280 RepID=A0A1T5DFE2_9SPHI|nr:nucleotide sugar dehydrogenase [Parapedobacter luteus]SKB70331.1 UDP-N-acetyl-D-galactosamine dehydrogenase [Parapedobacter luteus]